MAIHLNRSVSRINETLRYDPVWKEMEFSSSPEESHAHVPLGWNLGFFWDFSLIFTYELL